MKSFIKMLTAAIFAAAASTPISHATDLPNFVGAGVPSSATESRSQTGLRFLVTLDFPPFSFLDPTGHLNGYNIYLAKLICSELKLEGNCTIQAIAWNELDASLDRGVGNALLAGVAATEENRKAFAFSKPYMRLPARFISLASNAEIGAPNGLDGAKIGVISSSAFEKMARSFFPKAAITGYTTEDKLRADLKSGKIDLIFGDAMQLSFWLGVDEGRQCCRFVGQPYYSDYFLGEGMRIAYRAEAADLREAIDGALVELQRKGKLDELYLRFFPVGLF